MNNKVELILENLRALRTVEKQGVDVSRARKFILSRLSPADLAIVALRMQKKEAQ